MGSTAFKAVGRGEPTAAGSIPVHLRHLAWWIGRNLQRLDGLADLQNRKRKMQQHVSVPEAEIRLVLADVVAMAT